MTLSYWISSYKKTFPRVKKKISFLLHKLFLSRSSIEHGGKRPGRDLYHRSKAYNHWLYFDETSQIVRKRWLLRRLIASGRSIVHRTGDVVSITENTVNQNLPRIKTPGSIRIGKTKKNDNEAWCWLYLPPSTYNWSDIRWSQDITLHSHFKELQLGFRYTDFYNRYRFRYEDGAWHFDKVVDGRFFNSLVRAPFYWGLDTPKKVVVFSASNLHSLYVDGVRVMGVRDYLSTFQRGSIAYIFWDDTSAQHIKCTVDNIKVFSLQKIQRRHRHT